MFSLNKDQNVHGQAIKRRRGRSRRTAPLRRSMPFLVLRSMSNVLSKGWVVLRPNWGASSETLALPAKTSIKSTTATSAMLPSFTRHGVLEVACRCGSPCHRSWKWLCKPNFVALLHLLGGDALSVSTSVAVEAVWHLLLPISWS